MIKTLRRLCFDKKHWIKRRLPWIFVIGLMFAFSHILLEPSNEKNQDVCDTFDVVYTWVNGSDPEFVKLVKIYDAFYDPARFDDKNELKYSLRSLQKYAPWVRHVYIVTNGQIPHWLDMDCEKITVVQHSDIVPDISVLPMFSSSAIETFIHRVPNLSKRFLYMNDDIFLNAPLHPEDLHTPSEGVKVYNAWTVPDCAPECPWVYIGDGSCDEHCNIEKCQFDGGDCNYEESYHTTALAKKSVLESFYDVPKTLTNSSTRSIVKFKRIYRKEKMSFNEIIKKKNFTDQRELRELVEKFNKEQKMKAKPKRHKTDSEKFPFESTRDIYTHSLIHTNMLLNKAYGFKSRNVLAHVGFLLDRDIITDMQRRFSKEVKETLAHRFRSPNDLQFAFLYYNFLMGETLNKTTSDIFDEFDTDKSSTWSDREMRTLLTRLYPLPLDWAAVRYLEDIIRNCSKNYPENIRTHQYSTLVYERYEDSNIPTVSKQLVTNCAPLAEVLHSHFARKSKYNFHINQKRGIHSNFVMLTSNITEVVDSLDKLRRNPRKFNCINDNLEPQFPEENELIKQLLEDFYLSFFPERSNCELPDHYRNRFAYLDDHRKWKSEKRITLLFGYVLSAILVGILLRYCCFRKVKYARRYIPY